MRRERRLLVLAMGFFALALTMNTPAYAQRSHDRVTDRPWSSGDSMAVRLLSFNVDYPQDLLPSPQERHLDLSRQTKGILISPDGHYFLSMSYRFDPQSDDGLFTLHVFSTESARIALQGVSAENESPLVTEVSFRSMPDGGSGILGPNWEPDSRSVLFKAVSDEGYYEQYALDVQTGQVEQLTNAQFSNGVQFFARRGGRQLYGGYRMEPAYDGFRYPMEAVMRRSDGSIEFMSSARGNPVPRPEFYASSGPSSTRVAVEPFAQAALSPDGKLAVMYQLEVGGAATGSKVSEKVSEGNTTGRFVLLRFREDDSPETLMSMPAAGVGLTYGPRIFWSDDGREVVLVGVHESSKVDEHAGEPPVVSISAYSVEAAAWRRLDELSRGETIESADWSGRQRQLVLTRRDAKGQDSRLMYLPQGDAWSSGQAAASVNTLGSLSIEIHQGENEPPRLVASKDGREIELLGADPALKGVRLIRKQRFSWRDADGREREGGLLLPVGYLPGQTVPLVIQLGSYVPGYFVPDGHNRASDASQALAARGIAVLEVETLDLIGLKPEHRGNRFSDGPLAVARLEAVVDALVEQGIAYPTKIAISGFSRAGYHVYYTLTHPNRTNFAAAVVADATTGTYALNLRQSAWFGTSWASAASFWTDRAFWLEHDVTFHIDRVATPVLFSEHLHQAEPDNTDRSAETIGAFLLNSKPIDYLYFNQAAHQFGKPIQRVAMMESVVDWMAFWLLGQENPDPSRAAQYTRWRKLRADWSVAKAREPANGQSGFLITRSGLGYAINTRTIGAVPAPGDTITFTIDARPDRSEAIDSARKPLMARLAESGFVVSPESKSAAEHLPDGLDEVLRVMHPGEKATLVAPSTSATDQRGGAVNAAITYEIELISIE